MTDTSQTTPSTATNKTVPTNSKKHILIIFLTAISAITVLIYVGLQFHKKGQQEAFVLHTKLNAFEHRLSDMQQQSQRNLVIQQQLQKQVSSLNQALQAALQQSFYKANDWLLLKARYYLELAQINQRWGHDVATTLTLLQQADSLLANVHLQSVQPVRRAIGEEIHSLQNQPSPNLPQLFSTIDRIEEQTHSLVIKSTHSEPKPAPVNPNPSDSSWRQRLKASAHLLEKLFVIQHHDGATLPLPLPAYETLLRENIRLNLQEVQWALIQNNEVIYHTTLKQIIKSIQHYFAKESNTEKILQELFTLQQVHFLEQTDVASPALTLLNAIIDSKEQTTTMLQGETSP